jgi:hypothetical protein
VGETRVSANGIVRGKNPGRGAAIRATGPRYRLCQGADEARGKRNAPVNYFTPLPDSGEVDKSAGSRMVVVTREDYRIANTLRNPVHLTNINGPLWTKFGPTKNGPRRSAEVDIMSADGIVNPVTGE